MNGNMDQNQNRKDDLICLGGRKTSRVGSYRSAAGMGGDSGMTDWRAELIKDMINAMYKVENMQCSKLLVMTRAALAIAEPVIREECAGIADKHSSEVSVSKFATATNALCAQKMAKDIAAAIREGGNE